MREKRPKSKYEKFKINLNINIEELMKRTHATLITLDDEQKNPENELELKTNDRRRLHEHREGLEEVLIILNKLRKKK